MARLGGRRSASSTVPGSGLAAGLDTGGVCPAGGIAMKFLFIMGAVALSCAAQSQIKHGEQIFAKTCATGYCHGVKGQSSGAPRLAGRGFTQAFINFTVTRGVAGTGMPSFATVLSKADLAAVVAYVAALNGIANPDAGAEGAAATSSEPALS